jgi:hypothetical protein
MRVVAQVAAERSEVMADEGRQSIGVNNANANAATIAFAATMAIDGALAAGQVGEVEYEGDAQFRRLHVTTGFDEAGHPVKAVVGVRIDNNGRTEDERVAAHRHMLETVDIASLGRGEEQTIKNLEADLSRVIGYSQQDGSAILQHPAGSESRRRLEHKLQTTRNSLTQTRILAAQALAVQREMHAEREAQERSIHAEAMKLAQENARLAEVERLAASMKVIKR